MKRKDYKKLIIIILILVISIGFAYLSTNMVLSGTGIFKANTWDIYFDNTKDETYKSNITTPTTIEDKTTINFSINLQQPQSTYTMYANIVNDGTIDAMLDSFTINNTLDENEAKVIDIKLTYSDGVEVTKYDLLPQKSFDTIKVVVTYLDDIDNSELLATDGNLDFSITFNYVQADEDALQRKQVWRTNSYDTAEVIGYVVGPERVLMSYDSDNTCKFDVICNAGWEFAIKELNVVSGERYKISFDYEILTDYLGYQSFNGVAAQAIDYNSDIYRMGSELTHKQIAVAYLNNKAGKYSLELEFTATDSTYFVLNNGMADDGQRIKYNISNYKIQKIS